MMFRNQKTYIIINKEDITDSMINASLNNSNALRFTADGSRTILKFNTKFPDIMKGYIKYTYNEILTQIAKPEWNNKKLSNNLTTIKKTVTTSELEIKAVVNQLKCTVISLGTGKLYYSFVTGVDNTFGFLNNNDEISFDGKNSIFLIRESDSGKIQINRTVKI